jgi:MobA/MobL family
VYKSGGALATGRVQYLTRTSPYQSPAEARVQHQGRQAGTGLEREDLVYWRTRNLPTWANDDPVQFFSAAEVHERIGGVAYTEWRFSLPRELTRRQQMAAARAMLHEAFGDTHPYVWAFHCPPAADGGEQPHVHVLWSARTLDQHERSPAQFFKRYNRPHPERGGAQKDPGLNHMGAVKASRVLYTDIMNLHLEAAGHSARLHPDRLTTRGFTRTPEPRLDPSDSNAYKLRGEVTARMQEVLLHRAARAPTVATEQAQARDACKAVLGISQDMPLAQRLQRVGNARTHAIRHAPERPRLTQLQAQEQTLARTVTGLERYVEAIQTAHRREQRLERQRERREWRENLAPSGRTVLISDVLDASPTVSSHP